MKCFLSVFVILGFLVASPAQSQELYDDFTGPLLNPEKWFSNYAGLTNQRLTNFLEIGQVISKKKLDMFNNCTGSILDGNSSSTLCSTRLVMQDGEGVMAMEALVQPIAIDMTSCALNDAGSTFIRFGGAFFNSGTVDPTGQTNDVQAHISLRRNPADPVGVMTIQGTVFRCTAADCSTYEQVTTTGEDNPVDLGTINVKKKIQLKLVYDPVNHVFKFTQGKGKKAVERVIGYTVNENFLPYASNGGFKRLEIRHHLTNCEAGAVTGWARAYFDNFYVTY